MFQSNSSLVFYLQRFFDAILNEIVDRKRSYKFLRFGAAFLEFSFDHSGCYIFQLFENCSDFLIVFGLNFPSIDRHAKSRWNLTSYRSFP